MIEQTSKVIITNPSIYGAAHKQCRLVRGRYYSPKDDLPNRQRGERGQKSLILRLHSLLKSPMYLHLMNLRNNMYARSHSSYCCF